jgi:thiol:disulfide interchange protein DsbD
MPRPALFSLVAVMLVPAVGRAADPDLSSFADAGSLTAEIIPAQAKRGQTVTYRVTMTPNAANHAWTYPITPADPRQDEKTKIVLPPPGDLIFVTDPHDPPGHPWPTKPGETLGGEKYPKQTSPTPVTWELKAVVSPSATPGAKSIGLNPKSRFQGCNEANCVFTRPRDLPTAAFEVLPGEPVPVESQYADKVKAALGTPVSPPQPAGPPKVEPGRGGDNAGPKPEVSAANHYPPKEPKPTEQYRAELNDLQSKTDTSGLADTTKEESIGAFVLTAVIWGLISLVTPCVFPMIPITVSIFLKHAHGSFGERMKLAGVYCLTIIFVLGLSAFALLRFMAVLSVNPVTNVLLGALFVALALSLFGMYELTLPNFMVRRLQAKQAKGGMVGTIFGALAFTVISFTCVAPFLGGFAGISAADSGNSSLIVMPTMKEILGGLAFATAFAAPFFVLALVPGLLKALPKSGGWLDSVKVVMGFLELAAALKFFRTAELRVFSPAEFFTYDLVLAGWVAIAVACGLYLLNAYRLPHDEEKPNIGVMRLLFAVMFLGLGAYLAPGLLKTSDGKSQRPAGAVYAWVDAFLLPEPKHLGWGTDLPGALEKVRTDKEKGGKLRPIIVDFTGVTCSNCKYNENTVFPQAKVNDLLDQFERVQLYTDEVPADLFATDPGKEAREDEARANDDFKFEVFKDQRLPLYAVFVPTADGKVKVLGKYDEGKINSPEKFAAWLKDMLEKANPKK